MAAESPPAPDVELVDSSSDNLSAHLLGLLKTFYDECKLDETQ